MEEEEKAANKRLGLRALSGEEEEVVANLLRAVERAPEQSMPKFMGMVKRGRIPKKKGAKPLRRIIAVGNYRILFIRKGRLGKIKATRSYHFFELVEIVQPEKDLIEMTMQAYRDKKMRLIGFTIHGPLVPRLVHTIRTSYLKITCGFPPEHAFQLKAPDEFLLPIDPALTQPGAAGPANGFVETYLAQCNLLGVESSREIVQFICDLDAKRITDLNLDLCPGWDPKSPVRFRLEPITAALYHNTYFRSIGLDDVARKEAVPQMLLALRFNETLTKITLSNLPELATDTCRLLRNAIINNDGCKIQMIDFSGTTISPAGCQYLASALEAWPHSLHTLVIANCGLNGKGMYYILSALCKNFGMSLGIEVLDLSENKMDISCSMMLETWLEKTGPISNLRKLRMSSCSNIDLNYIARPLRTLLRLSELDISCNKLEDGTAQLIRIALEDTKCLSSINFQECNLSATNAANIITALCTNSNLQNTKINLADNKFQEVDADAIAAALRKSVNLHSIDLSNSKFKARGIIQIINALARSTTAHTVILNKCTDIKKDIEGSEVALALIRLCSAQSSPVRVLGIAGGFNKAVAPLLEGMDTACPLMELEISANKIGDVGAVALAGWLRDNKNLISLKCDKNEITLTGWSSFLSLFMYNHTLLSMPYPWEDAARLLSEYPNNPQGQRKKMKLKEVLIGIQKAVESNNFAVRGSFPVEQVLDELTPSKTRTDPAPNALRPLMEVSEDLKGYSESLRLHEAESKKGIRDPGLINSDDAARAAIERAEITSSGAIHISLRDRIYAKGSTSGYLTLLSTLFGTWKKRWFVLNAEGREPGYLYYWSSTEASFRKPEGKIRILGSKISALEKEGISKAFCMEIHTTKRTHFVHAQDKNEMDKWIAALKEAANNGGEMESKYPSHFTTIGAPVSFDADTLPQEANTNPEIIDSDWVYDVYNYPIPPPLPPRDDEEPVLVGPDEPIDLSATATKKRKEKKKKKKKKKNKDAEGDENDSENEKESESKKGKEKEKEKEEPERPHIQPSLYPSVPAPLYTPPVPERQAPPPPQQPQPQQPHSLYPTAVSGLAPYRAPPPPPAHHPPPPPPPQAPAVNVANYYIPRKVIKTEKEKEGGNPPAPPPTPSTGIQGGGGSGIIDEHSLAVSLSGVVSWAMSQRRVALKEENYDSDTDSSDWDSDAES